MGSFYEHVGVVNCIFKFDECVISERPRIKGRRTFNAITGLRIRTNGLTILTCNILVWYIVIPTLTYRCEIWLLSRRDIDDLISFQRYAGRRFQRLPPKSPSDICYFGLGW